MGKKGLKRPKNRVFGLLPKKGPKVGGAFGKNQLFCILLKIDFFLIFCMKLETIKGYKLSLNPFLRKILILVIFGHFWLENRLSGILLNIGTLDFFDMLHLL